MKHMIYVDLHEAKQSIDAICCLGAMVKDEDAKKHLKSLNAYLQSIWHSVVDKQMEHNAEVAKLKVIKVGDTVMRSGGWGAEPPEEVTITGIELCEEEYMKVGREVNEVCEDDKDRCVFSFSSGFWSYGVHVEVINKDLVVSK